MQIKTAAGTYSPLLAIGFVAALSACATKVDDQPAAFTQAPTVEAIYARDSAAAVFGLGSLPDVAVWLNAADPHYPNAIGTTGAQAAQNVSPFPASYGEIVVEFSSTLDGSKFGVQNTLGSYCTDGSDPATAPFKVLDVDNNNQPLIGSICYDPTSPLNRFPSLTFVTGLATATDATAKPFTCQSFSAEDWSDSGSATAFNPKHNYAIQFNTTIVNQIGQGLSTPTDTGWTSGQYAFKTSGFEVMAAGYQDQSTGYYTFIKKPYKGFLKDLAEAPAGTYQQPSDDTSFFIITTYAYDFNGNLQPTDDASGTNSTLTATRGDLSLFDALIFDDFPFGVASSDPRIMYVAPANSVPGFDHAANGGGGVWEPGQSYIISLSGATKTLAEDDSLGTDMVFNFTAAAGDVGAISIAPSNGSLAQLPYGKNGPGAVFQAFGVGGAPLGSTSPSIIVVEYNAPIDAAGATTDNFVVKGPDGTVVDGAVAIPPGLNNETITFQPTNPLLPATTYTVDVNNLKVDAAIPGFSAAAFPEKKATFTTATMRTSSLARLCVSYPNLDECPGKPGLASADRAANQPLQIMRDEAIYPLDFSFSRPATNVDNTNVAVIEVNADGTPGTTLDQSLVTITQGSSAFNDHIVLDNSYPIKCGQKYELKFATSIVDDESPAVNLAAEGCKSGDCSDIRSFTTQVYKPLPLDAAGDVIYYTALGDPDPFTGNPSTTDQFLIMFNASLDSATANPLLEAGKVLQLSDSTGAAVPLTCPDLPDDNQVFIVCTANSPLSLNQTYVATMLITTDAPLKIAAQTVLAQLPIDDGNGGYITATPPDTFTGDQTSCVFAGTEALVFQTPCPPARRPNHRAAHHPRFGKLPHKALELAQQ